MQLSTNMHGRSAMSGVLSPQARQDTQRTKVALPKLMLQTVVYSILVILFAACQLQPTQRGSRRYFFGVTVVTVPKGAPERPDFTVSEVSNVGIGVGGGSVLFGYNRTKDVSLPHDGAIYMEVHTSEHFEAAKRLIERLPNKSICVTLKAPPSNSSGAGR